MSKGSHVRWFDGMAMLASGLCLLHCAALPLVIAVLPMAVKLAGATEAIHLWLLMSALPTSLYALTAGARRSRRAGALLCGVAALSLLFLGWWFEEIHGTALTVSGSLLLATSHIANWRLR